MSHLLHAPEEPRGAGSCVCHEEVALRAAMNADALRERQAALRAFALALMRHVLAAGGHGVLVQASVARADRGGYGPQTKDAALPSDKLRFADTGSVLPPRIVPGSPSASCRCRDQRRR